MPCRGALGDGQIQRARARRHLALAGFHHFAPGAAHQADDDAFDAAIAHDQV
jgi:hypothetical protein